MLLPFENAVAFYIRANDLMADGERLLLAVSGGADSMAMLYSLHTLRRDGTINAELFVGHINHNLRGEASDGDEAFVLEQADSLGIKARSVRVDVRSHATAQKLSIETAARELRHEALTRLAQELRCTSIATAHQRDDNAETVVHRLLRGTGYRGLTGIWPKRRTASGITLIRPLLPVSRNEIFEYLAQRGAKWRHDASNDRLDHTRNLIRHRLLPEISRGTGERLAGELSMLVAASLRYYLSVTEKAERIWSKLLLSEGSNEIDLDRSVFNYCEPAVQVEIIQRCLARMGCGERDMTAAHYIKIISLSDNTTLITRFSLPGGVSVRFSKKVLSFTQEARENTYELNEQYINIPGETIYGGWQITTKVLDTTSLDIERLKQVKSNTAEWLDLSLVCGKIRVRQRRDGDRFIPFGGYEQKVGKFLTAASIPEQLRRRVILFEDEKKIVWVAPVRVCNQTRITSETRNILEIAIKPAEESELAS